VDLHGGGDDVHGEDTNQMVLELKDLFFYNFSHVFINMIVTENLHNNFKIYKIN